MDKLINNKQRVWTAYTRGKNAAAKGLTKININDLYADVQRSRKAVITEGYRLRNAFWSNIAKDMDALFLKNAWGPLTQIIKTMYGPEKLSYKSGQCSQIGMMRNSDGTETKSLQEVNVRFLEHFKVLLNQGSNVPTDTWNDILPQARPAALELGVPFTIEECREALKQCPPNKAPGLSGIPIESLQFGQSDNLLQQYCNLFNRMLSDGYVPETMKEVKVIPIYKSGSRDLCDNYRGISLMEHQLKWLERLILNRIHPFAEDDIADMIPDSQWGFRKDRSAMDAIMINRLLTTSALSRSTHIYKCFVDLSKAYDRVDRPLLWELLRRYGIPPNIVRLMENLHTDSHAVVITPGYPHPSERFALNHGLKQGSVLAPLLFNIFSGAMMRRTKLLLHNKRAGTRLVYDLNQSPIDLSQLHSQDLGSSLPETLIQELLYADDCVLFAESEVQLQQLVSAYTQAAEDFGQIVSPSKTKVMAVQQTLDGKMPVIPAIRLHATDTLPLQVVEDFSYLGSLDTQNGNMDMEIRLRMSRMRGAFFRLAGRVFENHALSLQPKLMLFKMFVVPVALYGCATWDVTIKQIKLLESCQYRLLRRLLRPYVPQPIRPAQTSYITLLDKTTTTTLGTIYPIETMIFHLTLRYLGHIERSRPNSMVRRTLHGHIVISDMGKSWKLQNYHKAASRALNAFQIPMYFCKEGEPDHWVSASQDSSKDGKRRWSQAVKKGAVTHNSEWRRRRQCTNNRPVPPQQFPIEVAPLFPAVLVTTHSLATPAPPPLSTVIAVSPILLDASATVPSHIRKGAAWKRKQRLHNRHKASTILTQPPLQPPLSVTATQPPVGDIISLEPQLVTHAARAPVLASINPKDQPADHSPLLLPIPLLAPPPVHHRSARNKRRRLASQTNEDSSQDKTRQRTRW
mgnify:CR=1 FL=1